MLVISNKPVPPFTGFGCKDNKNNNKLYNFSQFFLLLSVILTIILFPPSFGALRCLRTHRRLVKRLLSANRRLFSENNRLLFAENRLLFAENRLLFPENRLLFPENRLLFPENRRLFPENRLLFPENRLLFPENRLFTTPRPYKGRFPPLQLPAPIRGGVRGGVNQKMSHPIKNRL